MNIRRENNCSRGQNGSGPATNAWGRATGRRSINGGRVLARTNKRWGLLNSMEDQDILLVGGVKVQANIRQGSNYSRGRIGSGPATNGWGRATGRRWINGGRVLAPTNKRWGLLNSTEDQDILLVGGVRVQASIKPRSNYSRGRIGSSPAMNRWGRATGP